MTETVLTVPAGDEGARLDVYVANVVGSRSAAQRLIAAGRVTVDGLERQKRHALAEGQVVRIAHEEPAPADVGRGEPARFSVAYEDEHLLVVDKPAGVVVHPAPGHSDGTLSQALAARGAQGGEAWRPGIVHRLDKETSGLLVVAKSEQVHRALQRQIRAREVTRAYLALVDGRPPSRSGTIDAPIGRDRKHRTAVSTRTDRPRSARTHFETLEDMPRSTLLSVRLETGRTHQIRAHMAEIGHPVLGDREYAGRAAERLGLERQFLHSAQLEFDHPVDGRRMTVESPLPADLEAALERARTEPGGS
jgi:23S rRNA pseudouridine1911/1915/1917 synthase